MPLDNKQVPDLRVEVRRKSDSVAKSKIVPLALAPRRVMDALPSATLFNSSVADATRDLKRGDPIVTSKLRLRNVVYDIQVLPGPQKGNKRIGRVEISDPDIEHTYVGTREQVTLQLRREVKALEERASRIRLLLRVINRL